MKCNELGRALCIRKYAKRRRSGWVGQGREGKGVPRGVALEFMSCTLRVELAASAKNAASLQAKLKNCNYQRQEREKEREGRSKRGGNLNIIQIEIQIRLRIQLLF